MENKVEVLNIKKGTIIKIQGIPFELKDDTEVFGLQTNLELVSKLEKE